jgi:signal transduction histidine kinase
LSAKALRRTATGGSALGLAIVRQLAQAQSSKGALTPREGGAWW